MCNCEKTYEAKAQYNSTSSGIGRATIALGADNPLEEVGELRQRIITVNDGVNELHSALSHLKSKLTPILNIKPESLDKALATSPSMSDIGQRLQTAIDGVRSAIIRIRELTEDAAI